MKVILMQRVERLGEPGQQVEVADGYARNFLLPQRLAVLATPGRVRSLAQLTAQARNREDRTKQEAAALAERLSAVQVMLTRRATDEAPAAPVVPIEAPPSASETSATAETPAAVPAAPTVPRLFGSVTSHDLSEALAAQGITVDKKKILLPDPIKTLGVHKVPVRLHADVLAELAVTVEREV
jgi:large subunit ribosomal protein L9